MKPAPLLRAAVVLLAPAFAPLAPLAPLGLVAPSVALASSPPELTDETYAAVRDQVLPDEDELAWRAIGWRASFWEAVRVAQEEERPILLWAMNGHPLGCT